MAMTEHVERFSDEVYLAVPTASIIHYKKAMSDLFVRLPSDKMVKFAHKGESIDYERINRYGAKDVRVIYVFKNEFADLVNELVRGATAFGAGKATTDEKVGRFFNVAEALYCELLRLPLTEDSFSRAVTLTGEISHNIIHKPDFGKLIKSVIGMGDEFARHSTGTVVMANMLMVPMEWKNTKLVEPITMGAFFHDIGLKEIPEELRFKDRIEMTKEESQLWESHVGIGVQLLNTFNFLSPEALRIVQEHHEVPNGTGFPNRLRLDRMFPMAKVVSLANMLAQDIFDAGHDGKPFSIENLLKKIDYIYSVMYGQELAKAARKIFRKDEA